MVNTLARHWWTLALRGLLAVVFGLLAIVWPGITLTALVLLFGAYALSDGVFAIVAAVQRRGPWWALLLEGVAGIGAGIVAFLWPGITAIALLYVIAIWAVITGVFEVITAIRLRKVIEGEALLILSGVASLAFGVIMMLRPAVGALAVVWLIAAYALIFGALLLTLGFRLRSIAQHGAASTDTPGRQVGA